MAKKKFLSDLFLFELFKLSLRNTKLFELSKDHIEYHYLPDENYKYIWKAICDHHELSGNLITIGLLGQKFEADNEITTLLRKIKDTPVPDEDDILDQLELFIKQMLFISTHESLAAKFNEQDDEGAFQLMLEVAEKLSDFKIKDERHYDIIIGGMSDRIETRQADFLATDMSKYKPKKIPTGFLLGLDDQMMGGIDRKDTMMLMGPSGSGKSKMMKYSGYYNSKLGNRVIHIQAEGSKEEAEQCYDAAYAGTNISVMETGMLGEDTLNELEIALDNIAAKGGEIHLKAFESFDEGSLLDVKNYIQEIVDLYGPIDLIVLDYLELLHPGDGKKYGTSNEQERKRREALGNGFKNLCMEFDAAGITATQASTVGHSEQNDPKFVYRREHISEFKGMVKPFSYFVTINGTDTEKDNNTRRIHIDKFRKYSAPTPTFTVATNFENERFYDHLRTVRLRQHGTES